MSITYTASPATFVYTYLNLKQELSIPKALNDFTQIQNFETLFENDASVALPNADHHKVLSLADYSKFYVSDMFCIILQSELSSLKPYNIRDFTLTNY